MCFSFDQCTYRSSGIFPIPDETRFRILLTCSWESKPLRKGSGEGSFIENISGLEGKPNINFLLIHDKLVCGFRHMWDWNRA